MNLTNLKKIFNHILLNVPEENINMMNFRIGDEISHECKSVGCIIGHCVILDDYKNIPFNYYGKIDFEEWSGNFTELIPYSINWLWCFGGLWPNNKEQILLRLKYFIKNKKPPKDWYYDYILHINKLEPYIL